MGFSRRGERTEEEEEMVGGEVYRVLDNGGFLFIVGLEFRPGERERERN